MIKQVQVSEFFCDHCGMDTQTRNGGPCYHDGAGNDFCLDCGLKQGIVDPMEWVQLHGFGIFDHASYDKESGKVIGFQKNGRGFNKYIFEVKPGQNGVGQHG